MEQIVNTQKCILSYWRLNPQMYTHYSDFKPVSICKCLGRQSTFILKAD